MKIKGKEDKVFKSNNKTRHNQDEGKKYKRSIVLQLKNSRIGQ